MRAPRRVKLVVLRPQVVQVAPLLGRGLLREDDMGPTSILLRCRMLCAIRKWPGQCRGRHVHRLVFCVTKYVSQALSAPSTTSRLPSALRTTQPPAGDLSRPLSLARSHLLPRHICRRRSSVCSDGFCGRRRGELTSTGSAQRPRARTIMSAAEGGAADPDFTPVTASRTDVLTVLQYWYS